MPNRRIKSGLFAVALFASGWCAAQIANGNLGAIAQPSAPSLDRLDKVVQALMFGIATVAVDAEAGAMRIAEQGERHTALERRVAAIEAQLKR